MTGYLELIFLLLLGQPVQVIVANVPARSALNLALSPSGKVTLERLGTVSRVTIEIDRVQPPGVFSPRMNAYVAWAVAPEGDIENLGEVALTGDKARFEATTRFDRIGVLVTAEPHYMVDRPGSAVAWRNDSPRESGARSTTISVETGVYDYSSMPAVPPSPLGLAMQAQAAFDIASAAGAGRLAESELRLARIAIDTMQEMLNRATPFDAVQPLAHEAIRRSQRAFLIARAAGGNR